MPLHRWEVNCPCCQEGGGGGGGTGCSAVVVFRVQACCGPGTGTVVPGWTYEIRYNGSLVKSGTVSGFDFLSLTLTDPNEVTIDLFPPNAFWRKPETLRFRPTCGTNERTITVLPAPGYFCGCSCAVPRFLYMTTKYGTITLKAPIFKDSSVMPPLICSTAITCRYWACLTPSDTAETSIAFCPPPGIQTYSVTSSGTVGIWYAVSRNGTADQMVIEKYAFATRGNPVCGGAFEGLLYGRRNAGEFSCGSYDDYFAPGQFFWPLEGTGVGSATDGNVGIPRATCSVTATGVDWCNGAISATATLPAGTIYKGPAGYTGFSVAAMAETVTISS